MRASPEATTAGGPLTAGRCQREWLFPGAAEVQASTDRDRRRAVGHPRLYSGPLMAPLDPHSPERSAAHLRPHNPRWGWFQSVASSYSHKCIPCLLHSHPRTPNAHCYLLNKTHMFTPRGRPSHLSSTSGFHPPPTCSPQSGRLARWHRASQQPRSSVPRVLLLGVFMGRVGGALPCASC